VNGFRRSVHTERPDPLPHSASMERAELIARASPPCHECGASVQRVECHWHLDDNNDWRPGPWHMVCLAGHRLAVEPLP
jgi:hypothetical protein